MDSLLLQPKGTKAKLSVLSLSIHKYFSAVAVDVLVHRLPNSRNSCTSSRDRANRAGAAAAGAAYINKSSQEREKEI